MCEKSFALHAAKRTHPSSIAKTSQLLIKYCNIAAMKRNSRDYKKGATDGTGVLREAKSLIVYPVSRQAREPSLVKELKAQRKPGLRGNVPPTVCTAEATILQECDANVTENTSSTARDTARATNNSTEAETLVGAFSNNEVDVDDLEEGLTTPGVSPSTLLEAVAVEDDRAQIEEEVRQQVFQEAVQADVVPPLNERKVARVTLTILVLLALVLAVGLGLGLSNTGSSSPENEVAGQQESQGDDVPVNNGIVSGVPTLEKVRSQGKVKCGMLGNADPETGEIKFSPTLMMWCKAMALIALGEPDGAVPISVTPGTRFMMLANQTIDIEIVGSTHTM